MTYDRAAKAVTYRSDKSDGPTAGTETVDPLEFLARVLVHIPDQGHVTTRYYGWYANRPRGMRQKAAPTRADGPPAIVPAPPLAPTEASRRWATLLQQIFEVDPLACPTCRGAMRPFKNGFVKGFTMTAQDKTDLLSFLQSLTDSTLLSTPRFADPWRR